MGVAPFPFLDDRMVDSMENPMENPWKIWMMTGGTPVLGNLHVKNTICG
jgi:hypothetical protein